MPNIKTLTLAGAFLATVVAVLAMQFGPSPSPAAPGPAASPPSTQPARLPRLVDLGAKTCIPCKRMAPILDELKADYAGRLEVEFIDVSIKDNVPLAKQYGIGRIPTQVFLDAAGKELWRHEGFLSKEEILAKWKELGFDFAASPATAPAFERMEPAKADTRAKDTVCFMCEKDVAAKTAVVVKTDKGDVRLCSEHCYFIMYSCLTGEKDGFEKKVSVTDWATGAPVACAAGTYLYGLEEKTGRPTVKAFADKATAEKERQASGGNLVDWQTLLAKELANRCGFCDRAVYPEDAAIVKLEGAQTWGCCSHCALGVAARTGKDIEVREKDRLTGDPIVVKTVSGNIASLEPATAVAWFGLRKGPEGRPVSAGCFHQGFFVTPESLKKWVEQHPTETGKMIPISQALADKMKLSAEQIKKACKIGECCPK